MTGIKMIITDLDGTVLRSDKGISPYTQAVFQQCAVKGIIIAVATARYFIGAEEYLRILNPDYAITTDGAMTFQGDRFLWGDSLDLSAANSLIAAVLRINPAFEITAATGTGVYWNSKHIAASPILYKAIYNDYKEPLKEQVYKLTVQLPDAGSAIQLGKDFGFHVIRYRGEDKYGFIHPVTGKIQAICRLSSVLGISLSEIAAFGDDENDTAMLSSCGRGVAVANALPTVRDTAKFICASNNEDGVAKYIESHFLS